MPKNPKKLMRMLIITSIIVGLIAVATAIVALGMKEYIIATAMFLVAGWQVINVLTWRKKY